MQVFQTDGDPPSRGRAIFATIGWTANSRAAPTSSVSANNNGKDSLLAGAGIEAAGGDRQSKGACPSLLRPVRPTMAGGRQLGGAPGLSQQREDRFPRADR